jgi:transglutaminase-like putative cysteine protease
MRFAALHKLVSYLLVGSALLALAFSGELSPVTTVLVFAAMPVSWFLEPRPGGRWGARLWTATTLAVLLYTALDVFVGDTPALVSGVNFLLFLVVNKLFNRRQSRDYLQLYVLSFVTLVAAAALNNDLSFAPCFLMYIICATWSLIFLHLRREMEENYLLRHTEPDAQAKRVEVQRILHSRRIVGGRFLFATSLLSIGIFVASSLLFFLFPRVGFGLLLGKSRAGLSMAGFSERIELGQFGVIKDNPTIVLRAELPDLPPRPRLDWRWRGIAFDRYDGKTWRKDTAGWKQLKRGRGRTHGLFLVVDAPDLSRALRAQVYLEPVSDSNVLFTPGKPLAVQLPEKRTYTAADPRYVRRDSLGDLSMDGDPSLSVSYTVLFTEEEPTPAALRAAPERTPGRIATRYLQLPRLSPQVQELAQSITRGIDGRYDRILAVERYLRGNYTYTLDLKRNSALAPLEDFLFEQKAGHCEYFSTAMVILLRTLGIAARNVNGFLGGEWNPYGRYYAVRQGDAHSWVEVYFQGFGWVPFDPTPPDARIRRQETGFFAAIAAFIDSLRLKWHKYVVEYDLGKQVGFFRGIANWFRSVFSGASLKKLGEDLREFFSGAPGIALLALLCAIPVGLFFWRRRRSRMPGRQAEARRREITELYLKLLDGVRTLGYDKPAAQTPLAFADSLRRRKASVAEPVHTFTEAYNAVRFGGRPLTNEQVRELKLLVRSLFHPPRPAT